MDNPPEYHVDFEEPWSLGFSYPGVGPHRSKDPNLHSILKSDFAKATPVVGYCVVGDCTLCENWGKINLCRATQKGVGDCTIDQAGRVTKGRRAST